MIFLRKFGVWIAGVLAVIGAFLAAYLSGRNVGKSNQREADNEAIAVRQVNEAREASDTRTEAIQNAKQASDDVNNLDSAALANELRETTRD